MLRLSREGLAVRGQVLTRFLNILEYCEYLIMAGALSWEKQVRIDDTLIQWFWIRPTNLNANRILLL